MHAYSRSTARSACAGTGALALPVWRPFDAVVIPFVILFAVMLGFAIPHANLEVVKTSGDWQGFMEALAFTIALSGLGWTVFLSGALMGSIYSLVEYLPLELEHFKEGRYLLLAFLLTCGCLKAGLCCRCRTG